MGLLDNNSSSTPLKTLTASTPEKPTALIRPTGPGYPMGGGYVKPNMMCPNSQGYVQNTAMPPVTRVSF